MPREKHLINLNKEERELLEDMTRKGSLKAHKFKRAKILLKADEGLRDPQIMVAVNVSRPTAERIRKLDGRGEAVLIATACSQAPEGHEHWKLRLLAGKLVELDVVDSISYETVRRTLKKTS